MHAVLTRLHAAMVAAGALHVSMAVHEHEHNGTWLLCRENGPKRGSDYVDCTCTPFAQVTGTVVSCFVRDKWYTVCQSESDLV